MSSTKKQLLNKAQRLCEQQNKRFTDIRRRVLNLLLDRKQAATAYELLDELKVSMPQAKPPTIYRALEFLVEANLIHRIDSNASYIACDHLGESHNPQLLVCDDCGHVEEIILNSTIVSQLASQTSNYSFTMRQQLLEIHGHCQNCQK